MPQSSSTPRLAERKADPLAGILWMLVSCLLLSGLATIARHVTTSGVPPFEVVFLRVAFAFVTMLPFLIWRGSDFIRTDHLKVYGLRVIVGIAAMSTWFSAIALITIGELTAISFLAPLFATVGAALFLGEVVRMRRWAATLIGFIGALVILRPGYVTLGLGAWLALASAVAMGMSSLVLKSLTTRDDPDKIVFISTAIMTPLTLVPALFVWEWPEPDLWLWLLAMGPVAMAGHVTLTRALAAADTSLVMGIDFARLPFAVAFGFAVFGEVIDIWTWVGAGIIFAASAYVMHREAQLRRRKAREEREAWPPIAGRLTR